MKKFIQLKLSGGDCGMFVIDTDKLTVKQAFNHIQDAHNEHKDDLDALKSELSRHWIDVVEPDLTVELLDLNADGFDVECHEVEFSSGSKHAELFAIGKNTWQARGVYDRVLSSHADFKKAQSLGGFSVAV